MNDQMLDQVKKSSIPVSEPYIVYAHYPPHQEDDINLVEIGQVLIQNWRLIFLGDSGSDTSRIDLRLFCAFDL